MSVSSIFTKTGIAPISIIASAVATNVNDCVITSSPGLTPRAISAILIAAVPEDTAWANLTPTKSANFSSNSLTWYLLLRILSKR